MKKFIKLIILLFLMIASTFIALAQTDVDYSQVGEDIEIMARVIDKAIQKKFPDETKIIGSSFLSRDSGGCQGIYLKGYGAIFMTGIGFPVAEKKITQKKERSDDLWQQTKDEMSGMGGKGEGGVYIHSSNTKEYNHERVNQLKEEIIKTIGDYGSNIRQLASQEKIVVAINETSSPFITHAGVSKFLTIDPLVAPYPEVPVVPSIDAKPVITEWHSTGANGQELKGPEVKGTEVREQEIKKEEMFEKADEMQKKADEMRYVEIELKEVQKNIADAEKAYGKTINEYRLQAAAGRNRTTLIISVTKENIMSYKNNKIGFDEFLKQAEIIQY